MIDSKRRLAAGSLSALVAMTLGLAILGCSPAYVEFIADASGCAFGKVYEVVYEFKDNPTNDPMNAPLIVRGGQRRTVSMWPPGSWTRERVEVLVYELPAASAPPTAPKRLVRHEIVTVDISQPAPVLLVCATP